MEGTETTAAPAEAGTVEASTVESGAAPPSTDSGVQETGSNQTTESKQFDEAYVKQLRQEAAQHRTRAKAYEEAFNGYTPEQQEYFLGLARGLADPSLQGKTAAELKDIAERILAASEEGVGPTGEPDPDAQPLTRKEFKELQKQQRDEEQHAAAIQQIESEATALGFPPFVDEPDGPAPNMRYSMLLHAAQRPDVAGDMKKAAEHVEKYEKTIIDGHAARLQESGKKWPPPAGTAPNTGAAEPQERPTFAGARKAALAWAAAKVGQA